MLKQQTKLRVRLYARLSKDDGDADKESNSITNQLQMLRYNAKEKGFEVIGEYVDDGYSGTTFNRPDLNRMIKDAMDDPEASGIMVKDMTESEFVRRAAMDREVTVIEGMDELLRELRYQGNNLNQLTVMARQGRITQVNYEPFTEVYRNAWQTLNSLLSHAV